MKIVINVPEKLICEGFERHFTEEEKNILIRAIANGTPLPKRHGRLGDLDFVAKRIKAKPPIGEFGKVTLEECYQEILQADTIIEADGGDAECR